MTVAESDAKQNGDDGDDDAAKLAFLQSCLFDANAGAEATLLQTPADKKEEALRLLLHVPVANRDVARNLRDILLLLENTSLEADGKTACIAESLCSTYQEAYAKNWDAFQTSGQDTTISKVVQRALLKRKEKRGFHSPFLQPGTQISRPNLMDTLAQSGQMCVAGDGKFEALTRAVEGSEQLQHVLWGPPPASDPSSPMQLQPNSEKRSFFTHQNSVASNSGSGNPLKGESASVQNSPPRKRLTTTKDASLREPGPTQARPHSQAPSCQREITHWAPRVIEEQRDGKREDPSEGVPAPPKRSDFITAKEKLISDERKKQGRPGPSTSAWNQRPTASAGTSNTSSSTPHDSSSARKLLGTNRRPRFVPPMKKENSDGVGNNNEGLRAMSSRVFRRNDSTAGGGDTPEDSQHPVDERLKNIDPKMVEMIQNEIMDNAPKIQWNDIAGLDHAKKSIQEMVIWPMQRPDIFTGLRRAPKGLLLFGPPGTGKTMIGKCIASTAGCTFFSISASSLTSKWVGEGEKMVRALFAVARVHQPSVIFVDEIDSLLTQRTDGEVEASRRIKTEFLIQFDGAHIQNPDEDRILVIGATNRPQEIDEAARRRLIKRFYIPLPNPEARAHIIRILLKKQKHSLQEEEMLSVAAQTKGYSGSDMDGLCREAALGPIREIPPDQIQNIPLDQVRPILMADFTYALRQVRASVSERDLDLYEKWNGEYGSLPEVFERER